MVTLKINGKRDTVDAPPDMPLAEMLAVRAGREPLHHRTKRGGIHELR